MTEQHLDWLPIMDLVLSTSKESFSSADLIALRATNKAIKRLVDPVLFKKLELNTLTLEETEYKAIAGSPLLEHVRELKISVNSEADEEEDANAYMEEFWNRHKKALLSIISQISPRLELLQIRDGFHFSDSSCFTTCLLAKPVEPYKQLKELDIDGLDMNFNTIQTLKPALFLMTKLETVKLKTNYFERNYGVDVEGLKILAQAPFLENLSELQLRLKFDDALEIPGNLNQQFLEPLTALLRRCSTNLKILNLGGAPSLHNYRELLPNIENLKLFYSALPEDAMLPRSLEYLELDLELGSPTTILLCSGNFPQLKVLDMAIARFDGQDNWAQCMQQITLPNPEELGLHRCHGLTSNDVLCIAEAAPNIPKLREFSAEVVEQRTAADPELASRFFSSGFCRSLVVLELVFVKFADGFKELIKNESKMPCLERLCITAITKRDVQYIAAAGASGAWPQLQELFILCSTEPLVDDEGNVVTQALINTVHIEEFLGYCKCLFNPIWPALKLTVTSF